MRHLKDGRQFGRNTSHRRAMFRALTANLLLHERIETTDAKAKELRRFAERIITSARRLGTVAYTPFDKLKPAEKARRLAAQRHVGKFLHRVGVIGGGGESQKVDLIEKVFVELAQRYKERAGGYTRIIKLGSRRGDNAPISRIELVDSEKALAQKASAAEAGKAKSGASKAGASKAVASKEPAAAKEAASKAEAKKAPAKAAAKEAKAEASEAAAKAPAKRTKKAAKDKEE